MTDRIRRWLWYERGEGFAEGGLWKYQPVVSVRLWGSFTVVYLALFVASITLLFTPVYAMLGPGTSMVPLVIQLGPVLFFWERLKRVPKLIKHDLVEARGLMCPRCLYDLRSVGEATACPECGQSVDLGLLPRQWARCVRALRYPDGDREAVSRWYEDPLRREDRPG